MRRYQDSSGRLTAAGREHYGVGNTAKSRGTKAPQDMLDDVIAANGGKGGRERSYFRHRNCAFCSVAYEMRRRGHDVRSQEALEGVTDAAIQQAVKNLSKKDIHEYGKRSTTASATMGMTEKEFNKMTEEILKDGENSRGQVTVEWKGVNEYSGAMGGHALNYEVNNGTFYIVDPQIGKCFSGKDAYKYMSNAINVQTYRTDNKQMNTKITEKYYTEKNTGRVSNDRRAENVATALAVPAVMGVQISTLSLPIATVSPVGLIGVGGGAALATSFGVASGIASKKADKIRQEKTMELEEKWSAENRMDFYNQRDKKKGSKKK